MAERIIHTADLSYINASLNNLESGLEQVNSQVYVVNKNLDKTQQDLLKLWQELKDFIEADSRAKELSLAETRQIKIRQELDNKYGHYDEVRRIAVGVLQASDVQVVRQNTMQSLTEELMLLAPRYWLAPAMVALGAWLNNEQELASKALNEALKRDDEKTSLFFALVCRRAKRIEACEVWLDRYLGQQNPEYLDRQTVVLVDALTNGVFGNRVRLHASKRIESWVDELSAKAGFIESQRQQWRNAMMSKYPTGSYEQTYPYLHRFLSENNFSAITESLNTSKLHGVLLGYFSQIFEGQIKSAPSLSAEVDLLLDSLVKNFDDEELPLRQKEHMCELIIQEIGNRLAAEKKYKLTERSMYDMVSFTQLLTNSAMHPKESHASLATQRYAIALSKPWIEDAHQDLTAEIRSKFVQNLTMGVSHTDWQGSTVNGDNEIELLSSLQAHIERQREQALAMIKLGFGTYFKVIVGLALILLTGFSMVWIVIGLALLAWAFFDYQSINPRKQQVNDEYDKMLQNCSEELKAILAEVVDFRRTLHKQDEEAAYFADFISSLSTQEYLLSSHDTGRKIISA